MAERTPLVLFDMLLREALSTRTRVARAVALYTLLEAWRSRLPGLMALLVGAAFVVAWLVEAMALTEKTETRNVLRGALLRAGAVLVLALFMVASVVLDGNDRVVDLVLSQSAPRAHYHFGKLAAGIALAGAIALLCGLGLLFHAPPGPVLLWTASLALELGMVAAAALLCVLAFRHVLSAFLAVLAFYVLGRSIGTLHALSESPLTASPGGWEAIVDALVGVLYHFLPDLCLYTSSEWLAYSSVGAGDLLPLAVQAAAWVALLSGAALFDLYRRNL